MTNISRRTFLNTGIGLAAYCGLKPVAPAWARGALHKVAMSDGFDLPCAQMPHKLMGRQVVLDPTHSWGRQRSRFIADISSDQVMAPLRLDQLKDGQWHEKFLQVHMRVNGIGFLSDYQVYGRQDKWAEPKDFLKLGGDCEDFALTKYVSLKSLGVHPERLMILGLRDKGSGEAHASLLVLSPDGQHFVLDNQDALPVFENDYINRFTFSYGLNHMGLWKPSMRPV